MTTINLLKKLSIATAGVAFMALSNVAAAQAASITSSSDPALTGASVIDFESATKGRFQSLTVNDVTFSTNSNQAGYVINDYSGAYNSQGYSIQNNYTSDAFTSIKINFANAVSAFGFNFGASDNNWILKGFDSNNNLLDTYTILPTYGSNAGDFFGLKGNGLISYATVESQDSGDYVFIDNLKYVPETGTKVPEPSSVLGLLAVCALGVNSLKRKQQLKITVKG